MSDPRITEIRKRLEGGKSAIWKEILERDQKLACFLVRLELNGMKAKDVVVRFRQPT